MKIMQKCLQFALTLWERPQTHSWKTDVERERLFWHRLRLREGEAKQDCS